MIIKTAPEELTAYLEDPSNLPGTLPDKVYLPENAEETAQVVADAAARKIPLTVSAGGTGIVGGRVPRGGWVLSTEKLNRIEHINAAAGTACLGAGVVIKPFLDELAAQGLFYPPFPTEQGAFIGGTAATNASGEYTYKFGCTRKYIHALTVVTPPGRILQITRGEHLVKDGSLGIPGFATPLATDFRTPDLPKTSCGYHFKEGSDLIDLFIGSEGTLGIITDLCVEVVPALQEPLFCVAFLNKPSAPDLMLALQQSPLAGDLLSLEYFDKNSLDLIRKNGVPAGAEEALFFILDMQDEERVLDILEPLLDDRPDMVDTWASDSAATRERIYDFRKSLPETVNELVKEKGLVKRSTDCAVPVENFPEMFTAYKAILDPTGIHYTLFGHIGESHIHANLLPEPGQQDAAEKAYIDILKKAVSLGGTISAEHGIGKKKSEYLKLMYPPEQLAEMKKIKDYFDPEGILCPGNIF